MAGLALFISIVALIVSVLALLKMLRLEAIQTTPTFSYARPLEGLSEEEKQKIWNAVQDMTHATSANQYAYERSGDVVQDDLERYGAAALQKLVNRMAAGDLY